MAAPLVNVYVAFDKGLTEEANPSTDYTKISTANPLREFRTRRGRGHELDTIQAGTATFVLDNANGYLDPSNTASPYYASGKTKVLPGRHVFIEAIDPVTSTAHTLFTGYVEGWEQKYGRDGVDSFTVIRAADAFMVMARGRGDGSTLAEQRSDVRVELLWELALLNQTGGLSTDGKLVPERTYTADDNLLLAAQAIDKAEVGFFYASRTGTIVFDSRLTRVTDFAVNQGVFSDDIVADSGSFPYHSVDFSRDDNEIYNRATATLYPSGSVTTQNDSESQTDYGLRTYNEPNLMLTTSAEGNTWAEYAVDRFKQPLDRVRELVFFPQDHTALWAKILPMELGDLWTVKRRPKAGDTIEVEALVEQIVHTGRPGLWQTTVSWSTADNNQYWRLDNPAGDFADDSTLGSSTKLFY
jgi:hypothetical protein